MMVNLVLATTTNHLMFSPIEIQNRKYPPFSSLSKYFSLKEPDNGDFSMN